MLSERSCFKRAIVIGACVLFGGVLAKAGTPGGRLPSGFTLTLNAGDNPSPIPFTLAPPAPEPGGLAGPGGLGAIEDPGPPYRTALGFNALASNFTGNWNTAIGYTALQFDNNGSYITAVGAIALGRSTWVGTGTTAIGANALGNASWVGDYNTVIGTAAMGTVPVCDGYNTAIGYGALDNNRGPRNTAVGAMAGVINDWGQDNAVLGYKALGKAGCSFPSPSDGNTAIGSMALENLIGFSHEPPYMSDGPTRFNTALGYKAGSSVISGEFNIFLGANQIGLADDTNTIRIGTPYVGPQGGQNRTYIAGIVETPLNPSDGPSVVGITSEGRLGTMAADLLPQGPQGPQGIPGLQGPAGEGLVPGSLLYMAAGFEPPAGYVLLGMTEIGLIDPVTKKATRLKVNIYQKL